MLFIPFKLSVALTIIVALFVFSIKFKLTIKSEFSFCSVSASPVTPSVTEAAKPSEPAHKGKAITSPMVGTFYAAPSPDAAAFVEVGKTISQGDVVCIVEAMKLMNEIESEFGGEIVEICVKNEDVVEYGTPLFKIK